MPFNTMHALVPLNLADGQKKEMHKDGTDDRSHKSAAMHYFIFRSFSNVSLGLGGINVSQLLLAQSGVRLCNMTMFV